MLFFYTEVDKFNRQFAFIFKPEEDGDGEGEEDAEPDKDDGGTYAWLSLLRNVSDLTKMSWDKMWEMEISEFFSYVAFNMAYNKRQQEIMDKYRNRRTY